MATISKKQNKKQNKKNNKNKNHTKAKQKNPTKQCKTKATSFPLPHTFMEDLLLA